MTTPTLVIFLGGFGKSEAERVVDENRSNATVISVHMWRLLPGALPAILVTDQTFRPSPILKVDHDSGPFHFGQRLAGVLRKHKVESAIYMGGGSLPMLDTAGLADVIARMQSSTVITNNNFSSDLVAFPVNETVLAAIESVSRDNSLARSLLDAGLTVETLPRTVATQFDIDTPTDVAVLTLISDVWGKEPDPRVADCISRYRSVLPLFLDQTKQIVVAGRVGSHAWGYLERETACRVRLFAEERGMEADNRAEKGEARSLLGYHLEAVGLPRFFETLAELGDAAFIDTRVLLAHKRIDATREDRFLSDLGRWQEIRDPFLREFTQGAVEARIPVLLGGHSLMSGGLMALNEFAWSERDAGRL